MDYNNFSIVSNSEAETTFVSKDFANNLKDGDIILLSGDLGAGKTVFTKGISKGLGIDEGVVSSTFTIENVYSGGKLNLKHMDLYRLNSFEEFESTGAYEDLFNGGVCVIEWPEVIGFDCFPKYSYVVKITKLTETTRKIEIRRND